MRHFLRGNVYCRMDTDVLKEYADGLTWRRLASYFWVSERLTWEDTTKHFARAANDFQKLRQSGEYSEALFSEAEKAAMSRIDMCYEETNEKICGQNTSQITTKSS